MRLFRLLHPILLAVLPVASLVSNNILEMRVGDSIRSFALAVVLGVSGLVVGRIFCGDWKRGSLLAAIGVLVVTSYGHTYAILKQFQVAGEVIGRHRYLLPLYLTSASAAGLYVLRSSPPSEQALDVLSLSILIAVVIPLINVVRVEGLQLLEASPASPSIDQSPPHGASQGDLPDVYYIILDGYARHDTLDQWFGYDNRQFLQPLRDRGFYIAEESRANYFGTSLSLTASMNMDYLSNLDVDLERVGYPRNLVKTLQNSAVRRRFEAMGYTFVAFPTEYPPTQMENADYYFTPEVTALMRLRLLGRVNTFESHLLESTLVRAFLDLRFLRRTKVGVFLEQRIDDLRASRREVLLSNVEHIKDVPAIQGPTFTFLHLVTPHAPYIFNRDGSIVSGEALANRTGNLRSDKNDFYLNQLIYVNDLVLDAVVAILERSESPPIIILHSDHGPDMGLNWEDPQPEHLRARTGILNAYYLPDECESRLYPSITPVNSFRVVFGCVSGEETALLPDRTYFSNIHSPSDVYDFVPLEELLDE